MSRRPIWLAVGAFLLSACYHATIDTGRPPSSQVIDQPWAKSFVYGLVPPDVVETASKCPGGVSKVETVHSFLNELVGAITFGIFTPMTIRVTCAAGSSTGALPPNSTIHVGANASVSEGAAAIDQAAALSARTQAPVFVTF
jgi:hypothetical protein